MINEILIAKRPEFQGALDLLRRITSTSEVAGGLVAYLNENLYFTMDSLPLIDKDTDYSKINFEDEFWWGTSESEATTFETIEDLGKFLVELLDSENEEFKNGCAQVIIPTLEVQQQVSEMPKDFVPCEECKFYDVCGDMVDCPNSAI